MKKTDDTLRSWIAFASDDLHAANALMEEDIPNMVCFHAQQCIEKILKALLLHHDQPCPKIHDLKELYKRCTDANILTVLPFKNEIMMLSQFYLPTRYPDALVGSLPDRIPTEKDAKSAVEMAMRVFSKLSKGLNK